MKRQSAWNPFITAAAGLLASLFALRMAEKLAALGKPLFFPPVWLILVGWAAALICLIMAYMNEDKPGGEEPGKEGRIAAAFYVSLGLTVLWAALFFRIGSAGAAAVCGLLHTGVWLHLRQLQGSRRSRKLLLGCCIWAGYMAYLNVGIWLLN